MYVCLCKGVTDGQIKEAINEGATSVKDVRRQLGAATGCGKCLDTVKEVVEDTLTANAIINGASGNFYQVA